MTKPVPSSDMPVSEENKFDLTIELVLGLTEAQPRLYSFLLKRLGQNDQTQEVLQNVNLTICRKAGEFVPGTNFLSWAFAIARFELLSFRKKQARERLVFSDLLAEQINLLDESLTRESSYETRISALEKCVAKLPVKHQDLLNRRYSESYSVKAIAGELGRSCNAISMLLHRIRDQLMNCINRKISSDTNE